MRLTLQISGALLLCGAALLSGCATKEQEVTPEVTVQAAQVEAHDLAEHITADAVMFAKNQAAITPKIVAPVAKFYVQRGDRVRKGELLATLENRDLAAAVTENQGGLQQAEATYVTTTKAGIPEEVQKAQLDVRQAKENLDAQQKIFSSREELFQQGAVPRKDLDTAQVAYIQAKGQYEIAAQHLQSLRAVSGQQEVKTAQAQLTAAQGKYQAAKAQLQYTEIRSPIDGYVTDRPSYAGETPAAGVPLITVMELSTIIAKAHVPQSAAQQLHVGDPATLKVQGLDQPLAGKITLVSPALDPNSTTVEIWVAVENKQGVLKPGAAAQLDIVTHTAKGVLAIPKQAIVQAEGVPTVMLVGADNIAHSTKIETGITDTAQQLVQVTSGLKTGDSIVSTAAYGLPDGTKVKIAEPAAPAGAGPAQDQPSGAKE